jgi:hypothetical protein
MAMLVWVMVGLAIWHFTIFLPDKFWGGIVGAVVGATIGAIVFGLLVNGFTVPGRADTGLITAVESIPGVLAGLAIVWFYGVRKDEQAGIERHH